MEKSKEYDNDAVGLDALKMHATGAFPAGVFASYHAYPYYPEFMVVDPDTRKRVLQRGRATTSDICASWSHTTATCPS